MEDNSIYNNLFQVSLLSFKDLKTSEIECLTKCVRDVKKDFVTFELVEVNKKIEPIETLLKMISNKMNGDFIVDILNKDDLVLGKIKFKNFMFKKIENLIDFDYLVENKGKFIKVLFESDETTYIGKDGKEERL